MYRKRSLLLPLHQQVNRHSSRELSSARPHGNLSEFPTKLNPHGKYVTLSKPFDLICLSRLALKLLTEIEDTTLLGKLFQVVALLNTDLILTHT